MKQAIVFDCEFLTAEGALSRFWCGPYDPDPVVAQIGLVKLGLGGEFPVLGTQRTYVIPKNRSGKRVALDPYFSVLTGVTERDIDAEGVPLSKALRDVEEFAAGAKLWSWGKDELNMLAISCYIEGISPPLPASQFRNACDLLLRAGMPYEDLKRTQSNQLAGYFGVDHPDQRAHDALDDALSVAYVIQHLLAEGRLEPSDIE
ncbi:MAG: exonuclease [Paracoccaceae bacterium]